jgi:hypothetical protein
MGDPERLDWLAANPSRLQDVYWRLQNEDDSLREAIDYFMRQDRVITGERP